jgi:hypothetical protein
MLQVLGVVGGLALAYFLFTSVLGGDGGEVAAPTGPTGGVTAPTAAPSVTESPTPRETLPPVDLAGARDPFSIPPELATGAPSGSVSPTGGTTTTPPTGTTTPPTGTTTPPTATTTPPTSTTTPPTGTSPPPTSPPPPPPTDEITVGGHHVRLESVAGNGKKLKIDVDGELWTVEEGALFAENFKLVNIDDGCARFLFGDQSFTLCEDP